MKKSIVYLPMRWTMCYLLGGYLIFLFSDLVSKVDNLLLLSTYVFTAYLSLYFGYYYGVAKSTAQLKSLDCIDSKKIVSPNWVVILGCIYLVAWGLNQLYNHGAQDIATVVAALTDPGAAYAAKFDIYQKQLNEQIVSNVGQVLVLLGVVFVVAVPVISAYWHNLNWIIKTFCAVSLFIYVISYLFIGTQKGLGDLFLLLFAGWTVSRIRVSYFSSKKPTRSGKYLFVFILIVGLIGFSFVQASRAVQFGLESSMMVDDVSDTFVGQLAGEYFAVGFYNAIGYPVHGYLGLSHNLGTDFVFSYGAGLSQAFESYRFQYLGGDDNILLTYPYRTEEITGWPAGMYWSTAFPWFASDLTFFGVFPLMFVVGFIFAKTWIGCIKEMDPILLGILGQIVILIAFLPANNQVFMIRNSLLAALTLALIVAFRKLNRHV